MLTSDAKKPTFFLRFYAQTDAGVAACVEELKSIFPTIVGHETLEPKLGVNAGMKPSHEIDLVFVSEQSRDAFLADEVGRRVYTKHATGAQLAGAAKELSIRQPGMKSYAHG